jgi:uncharacterized membrane protein SirB2
VIEYYPQIRLAHITLVIASGLLFSGRGLFHLAGQACAHYPAVRRISYAIDTALLGAGLLLMAMLKQYPLAQDWLTLKLCLLLVYIVLGSMALKRARSQPARLGYFLAALAVYLCMLGIARAHHPLGWLHLWGWL